MSPGVRYLVNRVAELELGMAALIDERAAKDARIAELEKNQKKPRGQGAAAGNEALGGRRERP
jgi:hypothetical protein